MFNFQAWALAPHRRVTRTTNLLERLFGEERRRTKVIPHAFGERAVIKLMYAALIRASPHMAPRADQRIRAQAAPGAARRTRPGIPCTHATGDETRIPFKNFQQSEDLTS